MLVIIRLLPEKEEYRIDIRSIGIDLSLLREMLRIGVPAGLQHSMYGISNAIIQVGVNRLGTATVAAWALTGKVDGFYWVIMNSAGAAITTFIGQNFGAGKINRIKKTVKMSFTAFEIVSIVMIAVFLTVGRLAYGLFSDDPEVINLAVFIMRCFVPFYVVWTVIEVYSGALRGCGDALVPVVIIGVCVCLFRIIWVYTIYAKYMTIFCISMCYPASWLLAAVPMFIRYKNGGWAAGVRTKCPPEEDF
jgi:Na+-driven multidrug efflux pump